VCKPAKPAGLWTTALRGVVALLVALALTPIAQAATLSPAQETGLAERIDSFEAALMATDMAAAIAVVPPKVVEHVAAKHNVTVAEVVSAGQAQLERTFGQAKLLAVELAYEPERLVILPEQLAFVTLPTRLKVDLGANGGIITATSQTLGLLDGDTWYLVSLDNAEQVDVLRQLYPALAEIDFNTLPEEAASP
jgi:hypothetical protein